MRKYTFPLVIIAFVVVSSTILTSIMARASQPRMNPAFGQSIHSLAMGRDFAVGLTTGGTVFCWIDPTVGNGGPPNRGQCDVPNNLNNVVKVVAIDYHALALKRDGTVVAWGHNGYGQTIVPSTLTGVIDIAVGGTFSMALKSDGTVVAWGYINGQSAADAIPTGLAQVVQISAGYDHAVALRANGQVVAWGNNQYKQINVPADLGAVKKVRANNTYTLAVRASGTVVVWGGEYSNNVLASVRDVPNTLDGVVDAFAGWYAIVALRDDGTIRCWGVNLCEILNITSSTRIVAGAIGENRAVFATDQGDILVRTVDGYQLPTTTQKANYIAIAAGDGYSLARLTNASVLTWGNNAPNVSAWAGIRDISAYGQTVVSLKSDGSVVGAGNNSAGQLSFPANYNRIIDSDVGGTFTTHLNSWGNVSFYGALTIDPSSANQDDIKDITMICAGQAHIATLTVMGTVLGFGEEQYDQNDGPPLPVPAKAIACGANHTLALLANGTVVGWGDNSAGQVTIPSTLSHVQSIVAANNTSLAILDDGTFVAWGAHSNGIASVPVNLTNIVDMAVGTNHVLIRHANGKLSTFGLDASTVPTQFVMSPTNTATSTRTSTPSRTFTRTATSTVTQSATSTPSATRTHTYTVTASHTHTSTRTVTASHTHTSTRTATHTATASNTMTPTLSRTATRTTTNTTTRTNSRTATNTATRTNSRTATNTRTNTATRTNTRTYTNTATRTNTRTYTSTRTATSTRTPTRSHTATATKAP